MSDEAKTGKVKIEVSGSFREDVSVTVDGVPIPVTALTLDWDANEVSSATIVVPAPEFDVRLEPEQVEALRNVLGGEERSALSEPVKLSSAWSRAWEETE